jgi:glycosyltransferase involved in cell wall biosynthesis
VIVLTRDSQREAIEGELRELGLPNLRFEYVGVRAIPFWIPGPGVYPYYICWQHRAYFRAKRLHREHRFDIVHHVTYGVFRNASYLFRLDAPFIFGPVGGGESSPRALRVSMPWKAKCFESVRDFANLLPRLDPFWRSMLRQSARVVVKTEETRACLPQDIRARAVIALENMLPKQPFLAGKTERVPPLKLLYAGRLLPLKGVHLAVRAIALLRDQIPVKLRIVGKGPEESRLKQEVCRMGLDHSICFSSWMPRSELLGLYATNDALLFPSMHDSGGTVVVEALAHGRPVICLDLGGPPTTVDGDCARIVSTRGKTEDQVTRGLADAILELGRMTSVQWEKMRRAAIQRARFYTADEVVARVYGPLLKPCVGTCQAELVLG